MVLHMLGNCNILLVHISGYDLNSLDDGVREQVTEVRGRGDTEHDQAVRYLCPCYRQVHYVSNIIGHKRMFPIQVEPKDDAGGLVMCGPDRPQQTGPDKHTARHQRALTGCQRPREDCDCCYTASPGEVHDTQLIALHICCFRRTRANNE